MRMTEQQWDEVINTNLKSAFNLTKAVQKPMLKARKGSIINMSSVVGVSGNAKKRRYFFYFGRHSLTTRTLKFNKKQVFV